MKEMIERIEKDYREGNNKDRTALYYTRGNQVVKSGNTACHAEFNACGGSKAIGNAVTKKIDASKNEFLEFIVSKESPYYPIIKRYKTFDVVRSPEGFVIGWVCTGHNELNEKLQMNFFKSIRTVNEHWNQFKGFWEKWKGVHKGLSYALGHFITAKGEHRKITHSAFDINRINLTPFCIPDHKVWDDKIHRCKLGDKGGYHGEVEATWGGDFNPHKIRAVADNPHEAQTYFFRKYFVERKNGNSDLDIEAFMKEAPVLCQKGEQY